MRLHLLVILAFLNSCRGNNASVIFNDTATNMSGRILQTSPYYFTASSLRLGSFSPDAALANPLKGLMGSPFYLKPPHNDAVKASLEFFYMAFDKVMLGNPDKVGAVKAFNWTYIEDALQGSASRLCHAVLRFYIHFPGQVLALPDYLVAEGVELRRFKTNQLSPYYGDPKLMLAMKQFITAFGNKYDGDRRISCIQLGLLGYWGEWHTFGNPDFLPLWVEDEMIKWYDNAFSITKLLVRQTMPSAYLAGFGRHDDSYSYNTLDGKDNGGLFFNWFFWPQIVIAKQTDFWKKNIMGGETRPHLQKIIFDPSYPSGTKAHQNFMRCTNVTHATMMFHHGLFKRKDLKNEVYSNQVMANANFAHARMGYNFHVSNLAAVASNKGTTIDIDVTLVQRGVAPFYYPLSLYLSCPVLLEPFQITGVEKQLIEEGDSMIYKFFGIPAILPCLQEISVYVNSPYAYPERPIKLAQGNGRVLLSIPPPAGTSSTGSIERLVLVNNAGDIGPISDGDTIDLYTVGRSLRIRAETSGAVSKVLFRWDAPGTFTDFSEPFYMAGTALTSVPYLSNVGQKTISVTAYNNINRPIDFMEVTLNVAVITAAPSRAPVFAKGVITNLALMNTVTEKAVITLRYGSIVNITRTGTQLNVRVDVGLGTQIDRMVFRWGANGNKQQSTARPYAFGERSGTNYLAFSYLNFAGSKWFEATAYNLDSMVGYISVPFEMVT